MLALAPSYTHRELFWEDFLNLFKKKNFSMQFDEDDNHYLVYGYDGPEVICTRIYKSEIPQTLPITQEQNDLYKTSFETIYKSKCNSIIDLIKTTPFPESCGLRFRCKGISDTINAGETKDVFYKLLEDRKLNAVKIILNGHSENDTIDLMVVDYDNIMGYGAGVILDKFGDTMQVDASTCGQSFVESAYSALVKTGLYVVARYTSTGQTSVKFKANIFFHKVTT